MVKALFKRKNIVGILAVYISFVFIQSLFFKYTNSPETQHIFETINTWANTWTQDIFGMSDLFVPPGIFNAYVIGTAELIASIFLLTGVFLKWEALIPVGAFMALGVISGAITFHLFTPLGIDVGDGGTLFFMACGVWAASFSLLVMHKGLICHLIKRKAGTAS